MADKDEELDDLEDEKVPNYEDLVTLEPEREVTVDNYTPPSKTIDEEEESSDRLTDKQAVMKLLYPKYHDDELDELARSAVTSRIFSDNFIDKMNMIALTRIEKHIYDKDYDLIFDLNKIQDFLSRGYEGRGIADLLELAGAETSEELDKISQSLGL
jgi:hypothetical protein